MFCFSLFYLRFIGFLYVFLYKKLKLKRSKTAQQWNTQLKNYHSLKAPPLTHHSDCIIEKRLPEHEDVQQLVDVDLLKHGQDRHGVHGWDDGAKQEAGQQVHVAQLSSLDLTHAVHHPADEEGVPQCTHHRKHKDGSQVLSEGSDGQEVASIEDDGRQQVEEEELGVEDGSVVSDGLDDATD